MRSKNKGSYSSNRGNNSNRNRNQSDNNQNPSGRKKTFGERKNEEDKPNFKRNKPFNKFGKGKPKSRRSASPRKPEDDKIRLNKHLAHSGIASRRKADELIELGLVEVNGKIVNELGFKISPSKDVVKYDGRELKAEKKVYVLLNKPKGFISTTKDERDRKTVMELVAEASPYRLYPVGRLDRPTTGVLLLTNDGTLTKKLTHPKHEVKKIYKVILDKSLAPGDMQKIVQGVELEEGIASVDKISYIQGGKKNEIGIEIHIGWNRVIRRIFEKLGYEVSQLDRVYFGGLTKKNIRRGEWRFLSKEEVGFLNML